MQLGEIKEKEIKNDEWHNIVAKIIPYDLESEDSKEVILKRIAPLQTEIEQEESQIMAWKKGRIS